MYDEEKQRYVPVDKATEKAYQKVSARLARANELEDPLTVGDNLMEGMLHERAQLFDRFNEPS